MENCLNKLWYIFVMEYYAALEKNEDFSLDFWCEEISRDFKWEKQGAKQCNNMLIFCVEKKKVEIRIYTYICPS